MSRLARAGFRVTLADRHIYSTFQPLLYQVATAGLAPSDVAYPLRGFAHKYGARFRHGDLAQVDTAAGSPGSPTARASSTTTSSWPPG